MTAPTRSQACALTVLALAAAILAAGCPRTRSPIAPDVPEAEDETAERRFKEARAKFEAEGQVSEEEFDAIARAYPDDPIAPYARLYAGMSAVREGAYASAIDHLEAIDRERAGDPGLAARAALVLGWAYNYEGAHEDALVALDRGEEAIQDDDERAAWRAAMAESSAGAGRPAPAIRYYDRWYELASAPERAYILSRVGELASRLSERELPALYEDVAEDEGPGAAIVGQRYATSLERRGDLDEAADILHDIAPARRAMGLPETTEAAAGGDARLLGAVIPVTGARARVGDLVMRGLVLASGTFAGDEADGVGRSGIPEPFEVALRDSRSEAAAAVEAVEELVGKEAIAVLGPVDARSAAAAAESAERLGLPLVALSPRSPGGEGSRHVFHAVHSAEERARSLARHAFDEGKREFAIFSPETGYGRAAGRAFRDEVEGLGGSIAVEASYAEDTRSFVDHVSGIRGSWDAIFVPDQAQRLELIAPALVAEGMVPTPVGGDAPSQGRGILLLSTAEFLTPAFERSTGRYTRGAVFAPGFYPDRTHPEIGAFVDRYEAAFGRLPTALDAYAYDAALAVRAAVEAGARDRGEVGAAMVRGVVPGVTGRVAFDSAREREGDGVLFTVADDGDGAYRIHAIDSAARAALPWPAALAAREAAGR